MNHPNGCEVSRLLETESERFSFWSVATSRRFGIDLKAATRSPHSIPSHLRGFAFQRFNSVFEIALLSPQIYQVIVQNINLLVQLADYGLDLCHIGLHRFVLTFLPLIDSSARSAMLRVRNLLFKVFICL